jgi:hypothetical protein
MAFTLIYLDELPTGHPPSLESGPRFGIAADL